jgi:hypothetical protein
MLVRGAHDEAAELFHDLGADRVVRREVVEWPLSWQQGSSGGQSDAATATKPPTVPRLAIATDH